MFLVKTIIFSGSLFIAMLASTAWGDLTGRWSGNDGGSYYLRQTGNRVHWYGEAADAKPAWSNVFSGRIDGTRIKGNWADVPKGRTTGAGELELMFEKDGNELRVVSKTGGFAGSRWTRMAANASAARPLKPRKPSGNEDCVRFDPAVIALRQVKGRWKIVDGDHWLFDFGFNQAAAQQSLKVIGRYHMNRACFIGRPDPLFAYMLAIGGSPSGAMAGEDCVALDPKTVTVGRVQGSWKIVSGRQWLFDFGQHQSEARQALAVIQRYGFNQSCFVGRPDAGFTYLRR